MKTASSTMIGVLFFCSQQCSDKNDIEEAKETERTKNQQTKKKKKTTKMEKGMMMKRMDGEGKDAPLGDEWAAGDNDGDEAQDKQSRGDKGEERRGE